MKRTEEELAYLMKFYQIEKMPIYYKETFVGEINDKLEYNYSNALSYLKHPQYAIDIACESIDDYIESVKKFKSTDKISIEIDSYVDYKLKDTSMIEDTYDNIFSYIEKSNNRLRYCNGHYYKFKDKEIDKLYKLWKRWIPTSKSFELYYGNGIVD